MLSLLGLPLSDFHASHNCSTALCADILHRHLSP